MGEKKKMEKKTEKRKKTLENRKKKIWESQETPVAQSHL